MKKRSVFLLLLGTCLYFLVNFQRTVVPGSIFNELQKDLSVPAGSITALGASFMYIYAVCQLITGLFVDRHGGFKTILMGGFFFMTGSLFFPWTHSLWLMYLLRAFTGLGASAVYLSMIHELHRLYPQKFTTIFGAFMCIGYAGTMVAGAPFVAVVQHYPWRALLGGIGLFVTALYVAYAALEVPVMEKSKTTAPWSLKPLLQVFKNPLNCWYSGYAWANWGLYYTIQTVIGKKYLEDYCGMSAISAVWILTAMGAVSAVANFGFGFCSQLAGNRRRPFVLGASGGTFVCYLLMSIALACHFAHPILGGLFLVLTICANMSPVTVAMLQEMNPPEMGGTTVAVNNGGAYLGVALFSNICGMLLECFAPNIINGVRIYSANSYLLFFLFAMVFSGIGFWSISHIPETGHRR